MVNTTMKFKTLVCKVHVSTLYLLVYTLGVGTYTFTYISILPIGTTLVITTAVLHPICTIAHVQFSFNLPDIH